MPVSIVLNPINDIQIQTDEESRTPEKSRNSLVEPIIEERMEIDEKTIEPETNGKMISSESKAIKQSLSHDSLGINMEANQVHPLFGTKIHSLSRSSLPSKLQIINFIRFKINSTTKKQYSSKEKARIYREVAKDLISIWKAAYIIVRNMFNNQSLIFI